MKSNLITLLFALCLILGQISQIQAVNINDAPEECPKHGLALASTNGGMIKTTESDQNVLTYYCYIKKDSSFSSTITDPMFLQALFVANSDVVNGKAIDATYYPFIKVQKSDNDSDHSNVEKYGIQTEAIEENTTEQWQQNKSVFNQELLQECSDEVCYYLVSITLNLKDGINAPEQNKEIGKLYVVAQQFGNVPNTQEPVTSEKLSLKDGQLKLVLNQKVQYNKKDTDQGLFYQVRTGNLIDNGDNTSQHFNAQYWYRTENTLVPSQWKQISQTNLFDNGFLWPVVQFVPVDKATYYFTYTTIGTQQLIGEDPSQKLSYQLAYNQNDQNDIIQISDGKKFVGYAKDPQFKLFYAKASGPEDGKEYKKQDFNCDFYFQKKDVEMQDFENHYYVGPLGNSIPKDQFRTKIVQVSNTDQEYQRIKESFEIQDDELNQCNQPEGCIVVVLSNSFSYAKFDQYTTQTLILKKDLTNTFSNEDTPKYPFRINQRFPKQIMKFKYRKIVGQNLQLKLYKTVLNPDIVDGEDLNSNQPSEFKVEIYNPKQELVKLFKYVSDFSTFKEIDNDYFNTCKDDDCTIVITITGQNQGEDELTESFGKYYQGKVEFSEVQTGVFDFTASKLDINGVYNGESKLYTATILSQNSETKTVDTQEEFMTIEYSKGSQIVIIAQASEINNKVNAEFRIPKENAPSRRNLRELSSFAIASELTSETSPRAFSGNSTRAVSYLLDECKDDSGSCSVDLFLSVTFDGLTSPETVSYEITGYNLKSQNKEISVPALKINENPDFNLNLNPLNTQTAFYILTGASDTSINSINIRNYNPDQKFEEKEIKWTSPLNIYYDVYKLNNDKTPVIVAHQMDFLNVVILNPSETYYIQAYSKNTKANIPDDCYYLQNQSDYKLSDISNQKVELNDAYEHTYYYKNSFYQINSNTDYGVKVSMNNLPGAKLQYKFVKDLKDAVLPNFYCFSSNYCPADEVQQFSKDNAVYLKYGDVDCTKGCYIVFSLYYNNQEQVTIADASYSLQTVPEKEFPDYVDPNEEPGSGSDLLWLWIVLGAVGVIIIAAVIFFIRRSSLKDSSSEENQRGNEMSVKN